MSKLHLPTVTLLCVDCLNADRAIKVIEHCKSKVDFGEVLLLTSIPTKYKHAVRINPLNSLVSYSIFMLKEVYKFIRTDQIQICQRDGWILNPESWNPEWLENDYTAPLFIQNDFVGSGGCSLRSNRIMESISKTLPDWDGTRQGAEEIQSQIPFYEDGMLSLTPFSKDFKIASLEQGADYGQGGNRNFKYFRDKPFSFHRTWQSIDFKTGIVDSSDTSRDIQAGYDNEIDLL